MPTRSVNPEAAATVDFCLIIAIAAMLYRRYYDPFCVWSFDRDTVLI
jgi:hypothetical protein